MFHLRHSDNWHRRSHVVESLAHHGEKSLHLDLVVRVLKNQLSAPTHRVDDYYPPLQDRQANQHSRGHGEEGKRKHRPAETDLRGVRGDSGWDSDRGRHKKRAGA